MNKPTCQYKGCNRTAEVEVSGYALSKPGWFRMCATHRRVFAKQRPLPKVKTSHHVRMFMPQFAPLVESGAKRQTVRPRPKRMPEAGDTISLRQWIGLPYRSKQRVLREAIITEVSECSIYESAVYVNGTVEHRHEFALADGFSSYGELVDWFRTTHGLPFNGILIKW